MFNSDWICQDTEWLFSLLSVRNKPAIWDKWLIIIETLALLTICDISFRRLLVMQTAPINASNALQKLETFSKAHHLLLKKNSICKYPNPLWRGDGIFLYRWYVYQQWPKSYPWCSPGSVRLQLSLLPQARIWRATSHGAILLSHSRKQWEEQGNRLCVRWSAVIWREWSLAFCFTGSHPFSTF